MEARVEASFFFSCQEEFLVLAQKVASTVNEIIICLHLTLWFCRWHGKKILMDFFQI